MLRLLQLVVAPRPQLWLSLYPVCIKILCQQEELATADGESIHNLKSVYIVENQEGWEFKLVDEQRENLYKLLAHAM